MPVNGLSNLPISFSYATCSIAAPSLPAKLAAIAKAGFTGIELAFPDLLDYGAQVLGYAIAGDKVDELVTVAKKVRGLCRDHGLVVMMLQPFANFEGWPRGSPEREDAFRRAKTWIEVMGALETKILQVRLYFCLRGKTQEELTEFRSGRPISPRKSSR